MRLCVLFSISCKYCKFRYKEERIVHKEKSTFVDESEKLQPFLNAALEVITIHKICTAVINFI